MTFWIERLQKADLAGVDNDTHRIDRITLGISPVVHTGAGRE